ncbi:hypothetical protein [Bizionia sp.]|uniref:hypothetical protein n=1 Tax=Bizionia sp. TaxID=1954480 RepID=UPI003A9020F1
MAATRFINYVLYLCFFMAILSCTVEDGEQGEQGIQGEQGEQGEPGTVNVMYSDWMNQDWNFIDAPTFKSMLVEDAHITDDFMENGGIVLGFFRYQDNAPYMLPKQDFRLNTVRSFISINFSDGGNVRFSIQSTDGTALTDDDVNGSGAGIQAQYKYVLIPGGTSLSGSKRAAAWNQLSYKAVCKALHIPE